MKGKKGEREREIKEEEGNVGWKGEGRGKGSKETQEWIREGGGRWIRGELGRKGGRERKQMWDGR